MASGGSRARRVLGWGWDVAGRVSHGELTIAGGGIALFALLATIPALAAMVSLYALVADPADIPGHLGPLARVLPAAVVDFLVGELRRASSSTGELSATLVSSSLIALYSARNAIDAVIEGLGRAYRVPDERTRWHRMITTLVAASVVLLALVVLVLVVVALPEVATVLGAGRGVTSTLELVRWPGLLVATTAGLVALYRTGASGGRRVRRHAVPGAVVATLGWLLVSYGLEVWVDRVADYQILYGAFASVIVLLIWFYGSAMCVLVGAVVNATWDDLGAAWRGDARR
ncbi:MAG: YihY/virulence factor BrkB family protein [Kofleriaceae bacterium]